MKNISIKIPEELYDTINQSAKQRKQTVSYFIRDTLTLYLADAAPRNSVYAAAGDLAGCLDAPSDLSTNKKYLDDYGK